MRALVLAFLVTLSGCTGLSVRNSIPSEALVTGRLLSVRPAQFGCGVLSVGSEATYLVIDGPAPLKHREINVLIGCIELSRMRFSSDAGDLDKFVVGQTHYIAITKQDVYDLDVPELPAGKYWFYLRAASLNPLRPNNSFKPTPLRGAA